MQDFGDKASHLQVGAADHKQLDAALFELMMGFSQTFQVRCAVWSEETVTDDACQIQYCRLSA